MTEVAVDGFTHFGRLTGDDVVDHHRTKVSVGGCGPLHCLHRFPYVVHELTFARSVVGSNHAHAALCWAHQTPTETAAGQVSRP